MLTHFHRQRPMEVGFRLMVLVIIQDIYLLGRVTDIVKVVILFRQGLMEVMYGRDYSSYYYL